MDINTTYKYWHTLAKFSGFKMDTDGYSRPFAVAGVVTPQDLSELTLGQLIGLSAEKDGGDVIYTVCNIVLGLDRRKVDKARAVDVVRFVGWVAQEVTKINKMFEGVQTKPTQQEAKAGIDDLRFGLFGLIDWYALRMGITNHDDVLSVPWLRVYKCLEMDSKEKKYRQRYSEIVTNEYRRKNKGGLR